MNKVYYDQDTTLIPLEGKTITVFGYGSQGHAQANNLRESGVKVLLGLREGGVSWEKAKEDGFETYSFAEAAKKADMVQFLLPDERHAEVFEQIKKHLTPGKTVIVSHGFNFHYKKIIPPQGVDVIMIAPKAPGPTVRREYVNGFGVPALIAVFQDASGKAKETALAHAKAIGSTRVGVLETTFKIETETDLFGEQHVLCGGLVELMRVGFDVLIEAGYPPDAAYFECVHEMKLIVDLVYTGGVYGMYKKVSNTAKYGGLTRGKNVITPATKEAMKKGLKDIQNGAFAKEWIDEEYRKNHLANLKKMLEETKEWKMEKVGKEIRTMAGLEKEEAVNE